MKDCSWTREMIPWYANGTLSPEETRDVTAHMAECQSCREELALTLRLKVGVEEELRTLPRLPERAWKRVEAEVKGRPIAQVDVGSFLLGFSLGAKVRRGAMPVRGDLKVLGRNVSLFNTERGGRSERQQ